MYMGSSSKKDSVILDLHLFLRYSLGRLPYRSRPIFYLRAGVHFPLRPPCRVIPSPPFPLVHILIQGASTLVHLTQQLPLYKLT
jgi:hypothetical protein